MRAELEGVRDEIGFLLLHQAYADRFFPGTSVLQTRLRYVFFVPWLYLDLMQSFRGGDFERVLIQKELELTHRLKLNKEDGVIGGLSYPNPTSQPASLVYWTALGTWGLLRKLPDGHWPSRAMIKRILASNSVGTRLLDDDGEPLEDRRRPFVSMPGPPREWGKPDAKLSFRLEKEEKIFLIKHLVALPGPAGNGGTSLLARIVEKRLRVKEVPNPWHHAIMEVASRKDRQALVRAKSVAAISAIGRGVYASLVESGLEQDGVRTDRQHRDALKDLVDEFGTEALKLDIPGIIRDCPELEEKKIRDILENTKKWLSDGGRQPDLLRATYEAAELARKGSVRSKLLNTPHARERRREWSLNKGLKAAPLHYRWGNVRRLLMDLGGER